jgi:hypothetical protein
MAAYAEAARARGVSVTSVREWIRSVKSIDRADWAAALIDERENRPEPAYFYPQSLYDYYSSDYLRRDRPPRMACYRRAMAAARA